MPEPSIKKERSLEPQLSAIPSKRGGAMRTLFDSSSSDYNGDEGSNVPKPIPHPKSSDADRTARSCTPPVKVKRESTEPDHVAAVQYAPATDRKIPPQKHRLEEALGGRRPYPVASRLSSRPISALATQQQTTQFTHTQPQTRILVSNGKPRLDRVLGTRSQPRKYPRVIVRSGMMDSFLFHNTNAMGVGESFSTNTSGTLTGSPGQVPEMVEMTFSDYQRQQTYVQQLQHTFETQHGAITELVAFNHNMHSTVFQLDARITQLEQDIDYFRTAAAASAVNDSGEQMEFATDGSALNADNTGSKAVTKTPTKRRIANASASEGVTASVRKKYRKKLEVKIPSKAIEQASGVGLPTPMLSALQTTPMSALGSSFPNTPRTPYTPGRIGPPDSYKKTATAINKRDIHNLNKFIPPTNVLLPLVPLTDSEVIVFFFNSLSKPVVSLRLYARGWGPASIVQALNDHRDVQPPYLRNTCSVKCTTAIKNGRKLHGEDWEVEYRTVFADAEDSKATDLIRVDDDEAVDYYVRALGVHLSQYPSGQEAGIFTACVKYCIDNDAPYTMSNVHQLAVDLHHGNVPRHPASPDPSDVAPPPQITPRAGDDVDNDEWSGDDGPVTPSPLAGRGKLSGKLIDEVSFTAINAPYEQNDTDVSKPSKRRMVSYRAVKLRKPTVYAMLDKKEKKIVASQKKAE
ncbi:hypothetical protein OPT61_g7091 [Boeremia exigua]|uniref:Uncharacterized protein n=1 Tax=Boeremia exigua TaxID=749465 RepID=A0ACC2I3P8_9PLEO|nr:hypothetical protein OPT61_g7091 [Boeremia exigua]